MTQNIPIGNNIIYTQRKGSTEPKDSRETILIGAERIDVGVDSGEKEIAKDEYSGLNYERNRINSKTVYSLSEQKRKAFFVLDLETGKRGWYPGCIRVGDLIGSNIELKALPDAQSQTLMLIQAGQVIIIDLVYDSEEHIWYQIEVDHTIGYVRNYLITNIRYTDPY